MASPATLQEKLEDKVRAIQSAVSKVDDRRAEESPAEGEWCVKEVLSHLSGPETESFREGVERFLKEDTPRIDLTPGDSYLNAERQGAGVSDLLNGVTQQYRGIAGWVAGLTPEQLERKAHMPCFKETPLGEYPTLGVWIGAIIDFHLSAHVQQLQALCE